MCQYANVPITRCVNEEIIESVAISIGILAHYSLRKCKKNKNVEKLFRK